jgi:hypothetical protein
MGADGERSHPPFKYATSRVASVFLLFSLYCIALFCYIKDMLILLPGDFPGYRQSRPTAWSPHPNSGIKALGNNVKEPGTKAASFPSQVVLRGEGLLIGTNREF